ncbi:MAG: hypothetical protein AAGM04_12115 [Pseudomonadota bacterium]
MEVTLRVVGIFFDTKVTVPEGATVKDVVDEAQENPGKGRTFRALTEGTGDKESPTTFYVNQPTDFESRSGNPYDAGEYQLKENTTPVGGQYTIWQYYITKEDGTPDNPGKGENVPYNDPRAVVPAGGTVIWRLVTIRSGPDPISARARSIMLS